jgi:hypothetical protein
MDKWYRRDPGGTLVIAVHAQPGARRTGIAGSHGGALKIRVAAPALEDRANQALVEFLAETFAVPRRSVRLLSGARSREKRFEISGTTLEPDSLLP